MKTKEVEYPIVPALTDEQSRSYFERCCVEANDDVVAATVIDPETVRCTVVEIETIEKYDGSVLYFAMAQTSDNRFGILRVTDLSPIVQHWTGESFKSHRDAERRVKELNDELFEQQMAD